MSTYLVRIEHINDYYNMRPVMEFMEDGFIEVDEEKFGQYGTVTICAIYGQYSESPLIKDERYCLFTITDSELSSLERTYSGYKIKASDFLTKSKFVDSSAIREVIQLPSDFDSQTFKQWGIEYLTDVMPPITQTVYLADKEVVFGPFSWECSEDNRYKFLPNSYSGDPYTVNCYKILDFEEPIYTFDAAKKQTELYFGRERHIIQNNCLPEIFQKIDCINDTELKDLVGRMIAQSAETKKEKNELKSAIWALPIEELSAKRQERILELVKNGELADQTISLIPSVLLEDEKNLEKIADTVLGNTNYTEKLYPIAKAREGFQGLIDKLETERKAKESELEQLEKKLLKVKGTVTESEPISSFEVKKLEQEKKELEVKLSSYKQLDDMHATKKRLETTLDELQSQYNAVLRMKDSISGEIAHKVQEAYTSFAFDGALSSLMLQEAAKFEREQSSKRIEAKVATIESVSFCSEIQDPIELVDFLYNELTQKARRNLSKNDIANLMICISQGFLTVFAGEPGTGKTSLVSLLANMLGLTNTKYPRYTEIAVEKGWTSRRDLIGYYNPLTKSFDAANKGLFSALSTLKAESEVGESGIEDFPYWVLLDEANLSPMEHYWADFMSLCDFDKKDRKVSLSEDYIFPIPKTLRFLATINLDHTTEILSPRLVDRAWIIMVQSGDLDIEDYETIEINDNYPIVTNFVFKKLCSFSAWESEKLDTAIADKFNRIRVCFKDVGVNFSPRLIGMIKRYCLSSKTLMDSSENGYVALDYAVSQKILPIITGYGETYQKFLETLLKECDQNSMPKCNELISEIYRKGTANMQYYQFFAR